MVAVTDVAIDTVKAMVISAEFPSGARQPAVERWLEDGLDPGG
ncbi:hypothetical protein GCM10029978_063350 [Actinoallomurus acanthiterrae]